MPSAVVGIDQTLSVAGSIDATEWWFVRRGLPHAIREYTAREDVWTRASPFLLFVAFVELFATFNDRFDGWAQAGIFTAGLGILIGVLVGINLLRGRRWSHRPDAVGVLELSAFVVVPALLQVWFTDRGWGGAVTIAVVNLVILGIAYITTSYGLLPGLRVGFKQSVRQLRTVVQLVARGLPLLLLITAFVFLNAEMWQVAHDFPPVYFAITVGSMLLLAFAFLALRVPREVDQLARFTSWDECRQLARSTDAPLGDSVPTSDAPGEPELSRLESINVAVLLTIPQAVQTLLVGATAGLFYVGFGLLAVRRDTITQWTTAAELEPIASVRFLGDEIVLTWDLLAVSGFVAAFSVLQFAVASVTDATYRDEFYDDVAADVRQVLAVRALVRESA